MPKVCDIGPYRFFFYSSESNEPPHVHILRDAATAKFWLSPVRVARSRDFNGRELRVLQSLVEENRQRILEAWHEHFGD
jgi:hypothetical protein